MAKRARDKIKAAVYRLIESSPADQLAVKSVVLEADISKQTLYNNYYGLIDVINELVCGLIDEAAGGYDDPAKWMDCMLNILKMVDKHKSFMLHLYNSKYRMDTLLAIADHVYPIILAGIEHEASKEGFRILTEEADDMRGTLPGIGYPVPVVRRGDLEILAALYLDILMGLIKRPLRENYPQNAEHRLKIYRAVLEQNLSNGLAKLKELYK